ncbi:J-type co-chaperone Jac1p, mitochondrial [Trichomonascus vanleenenianus]|uniref:J-type chaperone JAC1 n=1 Tax=Trichomonascus vanleenenianus TaxID=2268995 RepID=UPI003ECA729F
MLRRGMLNGLLNAGRLYSSKAHHPVPDYYAYFPKSLKAGPPPIGPFHIDKNQLRREFLQLQNATHPDRAQTDEENETFAQKSAQLNVAYKILLDPLRRAEHLLLRRGIDALAEKESLVDEDLLMDVLMAREAIADADSVEDVAQLKQENDEKLAESEKALEEAFKTNDMEAARKETVKLSYWQSIQHKLHELD